MGHETFPAAWLSFGALGALFMDNLAPFKIVAEVLLASVFVVVLLIGGKRYLRRLPPASAHPIQICWQTDTDGWHRLFEGE